MARLGSLVCGGRGWLPLVLAAGLGGCAPAVSGSSGDGSGGGSSGGATDGDPGQAPGDTPPLPAGEATPPWGCNEDDLPEPCSSDATLPYGWRATSNTELAHLEGIRCLRGSLFLDNFTDTDLEHVASLEVVCGDVAILGTDLANLTGLANLQHAGGLDVSSNPALRSFDGLSSLEHISGELDVTRNDTLEDIRGLERVSLLNSLWIEDNPRLASLEPLSSLQIISNYAVVAQLELVQTMRFESLEYIGSLLIRDMPNLVDVDVGPLRSGHALTAKNNPQLERIVGARQLTILRFHSNTYQSLVLRDVPRLVDISGLAAVAEVGAPIELQRTGLADLDDLSALQVIGGPFKIILNPQLPGDAARAFGDRFPFESHKIDGNLADDIPHGSGNCPWVDDGECDNDWDHTFNEAGTGLCLEDALDCGPEPDGV